jgi:RimJ/RimL family protein N-acetyltransferase
MTASEIPSLRTERLVLRAFGAADWDEYAAMEARPDMRRYRGGALLNREQAWTSMQLMLGQWALRGYGVFAAQRADDGQLLGFSGVLHPADWPEPELAWSIDEPFWGQGFATEAATAARDWCFAQFPFPRLVSFIVPGNTRSRRVAAKLGAVRDETVMLRGFAVHRWVHPAPGTGVVA